MKTTVGAVFAMISNAAVLGDDTFRATSEIGAFMTGIEPPSKEAPEFGTREFVDATVWRILCSQACTNNLFRQMVGQYPAAKGFNTLPPARVDANVDLAGAIADMKRNIAAAGLDLGHLLDIEPLDEDIRMRLADTYASEEFKAAVHDHLREEGLAILAARGP